MDDQRDYEEEAANRRLLEEERDEAAAQQLLDAGAVPVTVREYGGTCEYRPVEITRTPGAAVGPVN